MGWGFCVLPRQSHFVKNSMYNEDMEIYDAASFSAAIDDYLEKHPEHKCVGPKYDHGAEMKRWIGTDRAKPKALCPDCGTGISPSATRCNTCANILSVPKRKQTRTVVNRKFVS